MELKVLFVLCMIALVHTTPTFKKKENSFFKRASEEDYYDYDEETDVSEEKEDEDKFRLNDKHLKLIIPDQNKQADEQTEIPEAKYEVTEIVDDIPNNTTFAGPVIANFTIAIPLNNFTVTNTTNVDNVVESIENNVSPSIKRNYISIFHIKAEYDNDKPEITVIQNNRPNFPGLQGFRDYLKGVRQGIINGLQNFINNNNYSNNNPEIPVNNVSNNNFVPDVHNIVNAPVVFWNKLQRRHFDVRDDRTL